MEVYNKTHESKRVAVKITELNSGDVQFRRTFTISSDRRKDFNNKVVYHTTNQIRVHVKNGLGDTWRWKDVSNTIHIIIKDDGITYKEED